MLKTIRCNQQIIYDFNHQHPPILHVPSGTTVEIETYDCFENQIKHPDELQGVDWSRVNPATGPIYVEGAMPGDVLKVKIEKIEIGNQGVMCAGPNLGVLGDELTELVAKMIPISDNKAIFDDLDLPLNPMIGVIGVAPAGEGISCGTPGSHGGNMDNTMIEEGATLYFPIFVEGALFALGDFHAAMGDGEVGVTGIEIPGKATVILEVLKGCSIPHPMLENDQVWTTIVSAPTLDEAAKESVKMMAELLSIQTGRSLADIVMLLSAVGNVEICQIVDPLMTARCVVSKEMLTQMKIKHLVG
nr:acetamidase/formamidase family protein [Rubeoparvulum massiliense]